MQTNRQADKQADTTFMNSDHRKRCRSYNNPGEAHELTFSCFRQLPLFSKDRSWQWFVEALDEARRRRDFLVWAYVIIAGARPCHRLTTATGL
jgi:hypothetical protein